jgi:hypothetical protein
VLGVIKDDAQERVAAAGAAVLRILCVQHGRRTEGDEMIDTS